MARMLIVDDSALSRRMLHKILHDAGHEVLEAADGVEALELYFIHKPDLVFLDLTMAGLHGWDVLAKLREMDARARVIVATADIQNSTREMARQRGAIEFVNKPFLAEDVLRTTEAALKNS